MAIVVDGNNHNKIYASGYWHTKAYVDGHKVFHIAPSPNQILTFVKHSSSFTGNVVRIYNGLSEMDFGFIGNSIDPNVDVFISSGDGTKKLIGWYMPDGYMVGFDLAKAPDFLKLPDDSYCADFGDGDYSNADGIPLTGNLLNFVCQTDKASFIIVRQNGSTARYMGVGQDGNSGGTTSYSGSPTLWNGSNQITNTRDVLHDTTNSADFVALVYKGISLYNSITYGIGGYGNGAPGTTWAFKGKIKEISTTTYTDIEDANAFVNASKLRNSVT